MDRLRHIYENMQRDFHAYELMPYHVFSRAIRRGYQECTIVRDENGREMGYAMCCIKSMYGYVLMNYFAMNPESRGSGVGTAALRLLAERHRSSQGIIVELTDTPGEDEDMQARKRFYSRSGFRAVQCDYHLAGARCELMCLPLKGTADFSSVAHLIIPEIYSWSLTDRANRKMVVMHPLAE